MTLRPRSYLTEVCTAAALGYDTVVGKGTADGSSYEPAISGASGQLMHF